MSLGFAALTRLWWSGAPERAGEVTHSKKEVFVGLLGVEGCNTGGDGSCQVLAMPDDFTTTGYVVLGATAILIILLLVLAGLTILASTERRLVSTIALAMSVASAGSGVALVVQGPTLPRGMTVPLGLGAYAFFAGIVLGIAGSVLARRPSGSSSPIATDRVALPQSASLPIAAPMVAPQMPIAPVAAPSYALPQQATPPSVGSGVTNLVAPPLAPPLSAPPALPGGSGSRALPGPAGPLVPLTPPSTTPPPGASPAGPAPARTRPPSAVPSTLAGAPGSGAVPRAGSSGSGAVPRPGSSSGSGAVPRPGSSSGSGAVPRPAAPVKPFRLPTGGLRHPDDANQTVEADPQLRAELARAAGATSARAPEPDRPSESELATRMLERESASALETAIRPPPVASTSRVPSTIAGVAPPTAASRPASSADPSPACPQCQSPMSWVEAHLRFYCPHCRAYF